MQSLRQVSPFSLRSLSEPPSHAVSRLGSAVGLVGILSTCQHFFPPDTLLDINVKKRSNKNFKNVKKRKKRDKFFLNVCKRNKKRYFFLV